MSANQWAIRAFLRVSRSEQQRLFALTIVIGVACGGAAVAFHLAIAAVTRLVIDRATSAPTWTWIPWTIATPTLGALISGGLLHWLAPQARGSGIPQVKAAYGLRSGRIRFRDAAAKFVIATLQIGSGASLGREGPTVQICAGIASSLGRMLAVSPRNLRRLLPVGAAAGIAAAFNAPIAAVTFTIEEIVGEFDQTVLSGVVVAAALAAVIERGVLGGHPVLDVPAGYGLHHASSLVLYALLGVVAAGASIAFTGSLLSLRRWFKTQRRIPGYAQPAIGGLATGLLATLALLTVQARGVTGGGYETLSIALAGKLALVTLVVLGLLKIVATVLSYSSGGAGGIFAPSLFIGGMVGGAIGMLDVVALNHDSTEVGAFALVGMGAVFAGIVRAPITSVLIIFEMTGGYSLVLPLMIANTVSYVIVRRWRATPIYDALLEQDGVHLPTRRSPFYDALEQVTVADAMTTQLVTVSASESVETAVARIKSHAFSTFPVLDPAGRYVGLVSEARLRRTLADGGAALPVESVSKLREHLFGDQSLLLALVRMNRLGVRQMVVLDRASPTRLVGLLSMGDIADAQTRAATNAADDGRAGIATDPNGEPTGRPSTSAVSLPSRSNDESDPRA